MTKHTGGYLPADTTAVRAPGERARSLRERRDAEIVRLMPVVPEACRRVHPALLAAYLAYRAPAEAA